MYNLNKIVYNLVNPLSLSLAALALSLLAALLFKKSKWMRRAAVALAGFAFLWLALFSLPVTARLVGVPLERAYPVQRAEDAPQADAIVVLGGGMASNTNSLVYAEMQGGADRAWQAARLYRAGKAPFVVATGVCELDSTKPLLVDFGIPEDAIAIENESRNTEENASFTERLLRERFGADAKLTILLVTSAWHMRRSELMFARYAPSLSVIPSAADYEATCAIVRPLERKDFIPSADALMRNTAFFKEHLGYWGYKIFR